MSTLLPLLRRLEVELHDARVLDDAQLNALLHPDFREHGRSGARYDRAQIIALLRADTPPAQVHAQDFALLEAAPDVALLTYRSAHIQPDGSLERHTNRMSLWKREGSGWQMIFHQGTATAAFDRNED